ncbi:MarR family winged helix-turn-helix transcriptional regulator [Streptomyces sp. NPDC004629]|uniref:MarR family winged helix-turn-helix transcriptional regulator n=1 Tax=Streptomyces sp. NPDC004629 TaxID=3364705 RepID=UPI0036B0ED79
MSEHEAEHTGPDPARVGLHFLSVAHQVRQEVDRHMAAAGLSLARTKMLRLLAERGTLHQAELADGLGQAPRSVTQALEALERLGLVTRTGDERDRRRKVVTLTGRGRAALAAGERAGTERLRQLFGSLDGRRLVGLETLLTALDAAGTGTD